MSDAATIVNASYPACSEFSALLTNLLTRIIYYIIGQENMLLYLFAFIGVISVLMSFGSGLMNSLLALIEIGAKFYAFFKYGKYKQWRKNAKVKE